MNPYNSHNVELVKKINYAWEISKDNFKHILLALMKRDIVEMVDKNCFGEACDVEESYEGTLFVVRKGLGELCRVLPYESC